MKTKLFTSGGALIAVVTYSEVIAVIRYYYGLDQIQVNEYEYGETFFAHKDFCAKVRHFAVSKGLRIK